jgi:bifunctional ADP-heptose synthase (sugar kinase/adenylyltransferase)
MTTGPLVVVGDVLLDREVLGTVDRLCPEAPIPVLAETSTVDRPGGAGLAAMLAACAGHEVVLVGAFSGDRAGELLHGLLTRVGVRVVALPLYGPTAEKIRLRAAGHLLLRLDRGEGGGRIGTVPAEALAAIDAARAVLVSDYGRGITAVPRLRLALAGRAAAVPIVWDPHPRGEQPVPAVRLVTPNRSEAESMMGRYQPPANGLAANGLAANGLAANGNGLQLNGNGLRIHGNGLHTDGLRAQGLCTDGLHPEGNDPPADFSPDRLPVDGFSANGNGFHEMGRWSADDARLSEAVLDGSLGQRELAAALAAAMRLRRYWSVGAVAVTMADRGAMLCDGVRPPMLVPAPFRARGDSCGAGDRFASAALTALAAGATVIEGVVSGVRAATAFVASGGALGLSTVESVADPAAALVVSKGGDR